MTTARTIFEWISAALSLGLACVAFFQWTRSRARDRFILFLAMSSFGLLAIVGRINELTGRMNHLVVDVSLIMLLASSFVMMEFRHTVLPLSRRAHRALVVVTAGLAAWGLLVRFPGGRNPHLNPPQAAAALSIIGLWLFAMLEPAVRFRTAARHRPPVERARLRLLAIGYVGIVMILSVGILFRAESKPGFAFALQSLTIVVFPFFFIAVAPPAILRRLWLDRETERERARMLMTLPAVVWTVGKDLRQTSVSGSVGVHTAPPNGATIQEIYANLGMSGSEQERLVIDAHKRALAGESVCYDLAFQDEIYECRVEPIQGPEGRAAGAIGMALDVTERRRSEFTLRTMLDRERDAAQRLRALDEMKNSFLNAVSHELRTPLTSVVGLASTLQREDVLAPDERRHIIERLIVSAEKLQMLLGDLLDLDRLRRGIVEPHRRPTDVGALVTRVTNAWSAESGRMVSADCEALVCPVDGPKIERVIENLLTNAQKYTPANSRVWVSVRQSEGGALIRVEDEGPGVPPDLAGVIFEPFRQGESSPHAPGVGIGLSLVASFAALHGGRAWVDEADGGGAAFNVWLPGAERIVGRATA